MCDLMQRAWLRANESDGDKTMNVQPLAVLSAV